MPKSIWKFKLRVVDEQNVPMPKGAQILSVGTQRNAPVMWALCNTEAEMVGRKIEIFGTGNPVPDNVDAEHNHKFLGSFQLYEGGFVGHVFEPYS